MTGNWRTGWMRWRNNSDHRANCSTRARGGVSPAEHNAYPAAGCLPPGARRWVRSAASAAAAPRQDPEPGLPAGAGPRALPAVLAGPRAATQAAAAPPCCLSLSASAWRERAIQVPTSSSANLSQMLSLSYLVVIERYLKANENSGKPWSGG